jgi:hypothetical protein
MKNLIFYTILFSWFGCSTTSHISKNIPPLELFENACLPGRNIQSVNGSIWLKANSKEVNGQFPAEVVAKSPNQLKIEVTNMLGGTEAIIEVSGESYEIKGRQGVGKGKSSWGGIPLKWASDLFLGKIPCPSQGKEALKLSIAEDSELVVSVPGSSIQDAQQFVYRFREWQGKPWVESLHWKRTGLKNVQVDFKFDDPEEGTLSPKKWEAHSEKGAVKVRWRERQVK